MAAIAALKDAALIRSKKADWRLVAAAQAMRRGAYSDEFEAAAALISATRGCKLVGQAA